MPVSETNQHDGASSINVRLPRFIHRMNLTMTLFLYKQMQCALHIATLKMNQQSG